MAALGRESEQPDMGLDELTTFCNCNKITQYNLKRRGIKFIAL